MSDKSSIEELYHLDSYTISKTLATELRDKRSNELLSKRPVSLWSCSDFVPFNRCRHPPTELTLTRILGWRCDLQGEENALKRNIYMIFV